jgi:hypothetical protein
MATPRAFVSFDFDHDSDSRVMFTGQGKSNSPTSFEIEDWSSKAALSEREWENLISAKINSCHMLIVLVGQHMGSATGVVKEIQFAKNLNVPIFGVYVNGGNTNSTLPTGLPRNRVIAWNWTNIANAIEQMMGEGKNK